MKQKQKKHDKLGLRKSASAAPSVIAAAKAAPWDPPLASFQDGVALVESLFGGDGKGEAFAAFIQSWEAGECMVTDGGDLDRLGLPSLDVLEEARGQWGNLYVGSDVLLASVESGGGARGDLLHVLSTGADDGEPLKEGAVRRLLSSQKDGGRGGGKRRKAGGAFGDSSTSMSAAASVFIFNADTVHKPLSRFLRDLDAGWRGDGGSNASLVVTDMSADTPTQILPTHSRPIDVLLLQLEGRTRLEFHAVSDEPGTAVHDFGPDPEALMLVKYAPEGGYDLAPGSCALIPAGTVFSLRTGDEEGGGGGGGGKGRKHKQRGSGGGGGGSGAAGGEASLVLLCTLAPQPAVERAVSHAVALAKGEVTGEDDARVYPHALVAGSRARGSALGGTAVAILQRSAELAEAAVGRLLERQKFTTGHFNAGGYLRKRFDLDALLDAGGGIARIPDFLPKKVAARVLKTLQNVSDEEWGMTAASEDASANSIAHAFLSAKRFPNSNAIFRMFLGLRPGRKATFSAARYGPGHWIDPHDDRQYRDVFGCRHSREVALVYYLNKDWSADMGGMFVDMEDPKRHVRHEPEFNSAVVFRVPRWHAVEPVAPGPHERLSIFGWWLREGTLYDLHRGDGVPMPERKGAFGNSSGGGGGGGGY